MHVEAVVSPNTTASVSLPDHADSPFDVASGMHEWTYDLPAPAPRPRFDLDTPVADLVDDLEAWQIVLARVPEVASLELGLHSRGEMPLARALRLVHPPDPVRTRAVLESVLADLG